MSPEGPNALVLYGTAAQCLSAAESLLSEVSNASEAVNGDYYDYGSSDRPFCRPDGIRECAISLDEELTSDRLAAFQCARKFWEPDDNDPFEAQAPWGRVADLLFDLKATNDDVFKAIAKSDITGHWNEHIAAEYQSIYRLVARLRSAVDELSKTSQLGPLLTQMGRAGMQHVTILPRQAPKDDRPAAGPEDVEDAGANETDLETAIPPARDGNKVEQYNDACAQFLKSEAAAGRRPSLRAIQRAIGCGSKTLYKLPLVQKYREMLDRSPKPKAVTLTPEMAAVSTKEEEDQLARLAREQDRDRRSNRVGTRERI